MARARYIDAKHTPSYTGQLHLSTSGSFGDHDQMFAVGYLEGYISAGWLQEAYIHTITSKQPQRLVPCMCWAVIPCHGQSCVEEVHVAHGFNACLVICRANT